MAHNLGGFFACVGVWGMVDNHEGIVDDALTLYDFSQMDGISCHEGQVLLSCRTEYAIRDTDCIITRYADDTDGSAWFGCIGTDGKHIIS